MLTACPLKPERRRLSLMCFLCLSLVNKCKSTKLSPCQPPPPLHRFPTPDFFLSVCLWNTPIFSHTKEGTCHYGNKKARFLKATSWGMSKDNKKESMVWVPERQRMTGRHHLATLSAFYLCFRLWADCCLLCMFLHFYQFCSISGLLLDPCTSTHAQWCVFGGCGGGGRGGL